MNKLVLILAGERWHSNRVIEETLERATHKLWAR